MGFIAKGLNVFMGVESSNDTTGLSGVLNAGYEAFYGVIKIIMPILIGVILLFGLVYSIILGVNYAKAEDSEKREEAKKRLVGAIVGVLIAAVMVAVIWVLLGSSVIQNLFKD